MKSNYLKELRSYLDLYQIEEPEKQDIISDYSEMYDNWKEQGFNDEEVLEKLGKPKYIHKELVQGYKRIPKPKSKTDKYIALSPFVSVILFLILSFTTKRWEYTWMVFFIIPLTAIFLEMGKQKDPHMITALSPFFTTAAFIILGLEIGRWELIWLIFLAIPVIAITIEAKSMGLFPYLTALSPFAALTTFMILGFEYGNWNPGWLVFLIVPAFGVLNEKRIGRMLLWEVLIIGGAIGYYYLNATVEVWEYSLLAFAPLVIYSITQSDWQVNGEFPWRYRIMVLASVIVYILLGLTLNLWGYAWIVFLSIPMYAVWTEAGDAKTIAITPFVATIIYMTVAYFTGIWTWPAIIFLLIPVTAIIKEA